MPNPIALSVGGAGFGSVGAAVGGPTVCLLFVLIGSMVVTLWSLLETPADAEEFPDPSAARGEDRRVVVVRGVVFWLAVATVGFAISGAGEAFIAGLGVGAAGGFISGLGTKAWGRFTVARAWLFATRRLPLATSTFLEDAHLRGALRRVGGVYQFRHAILQRYLLAEHGARRTR
jgi:hypothetical protein